MHQQDNDNIALYGGLNLCERSQMLPTCSLRLQGNDRAEVRLRNWRAQLPFTDGSCFDEWLASNGLSEADFRYLLSEPVDSLSQRLGDVPTWLDALIEATAEVQSEPALSQLQFESEHDIAEFLHVLAPFIRSAHRRISTGIEELVGRYADHPLDPSTTCGVMLQNLPSRLLHLVSRTLVLELNVARLEGKLRGATAKERFRDFVDQMRRPNALEAFLREYPVLARMVTVVTDQWVNCSLEFLERLCADWPLLCESFFDDTSPGMLVNLKTYAGDTHRGGRSVSIADFSSGQQIVYKPRPMAVERHFQELILWVNDRGKHPPFRPLAILDQGEYGWVEYVSAASCANTTEVSQFYQRQGGYLAILHLVGATDFHFENIIAAGPDPMLIDLESLLHAQLTGPEGIESLDRATAAMRESVLRIGLLPQRLWVSDESEGIDLSGLGATDGQLHPSATAELDLSVLDEVRVTRQRRELSGGQHRPTLRGADVDVVNYSDDICTGFTQIYQTLLKHKQELLDRQGPLAWFAKDRVRIILRPTRVYGLLLQESHHPDVLRDALDRDQLFDRLWVTVPQQPSLAKVIPAEREELWRGDIPTFSTSADSRDLWCNDGRRITDFFEQSGMELALSRAGSLCHDDLEQQLWFIRASLSTLTDKPQRDRTATKRVHGVDSQATGERLLTAAQEVANHLNRLALRGPGSEDASWLGLAPAGLQNWKLTPLGPDLYSGVAGIALFGAYLGAATGDSRSTALARAALVTLRRQITLAESHFTSIGGFDGWGGIIYVLAHLGSIWEEPSLLAEAESLVPRVAQRIEKDHKLDIMSGAAGAIAALLALYRTTGHTPALATATACGQWLIANRPHCSQQALTGFSHGAAGIAWALVELGSATKESHFHDEAMSALAFERRLFSPTAGNWPDLRRCDDADGRDANRQPKFMCAWCHGAAGIGLARIRSLSHWEDSESRAEIDVALETTLAQGFGSNHSLCHGDLGNLELLLEAGRRLEDVTDARHSQQVTAAILDSIEQYGWQCGVPQGVETPGFMTGLAGIGYGLLRAWAPDQVPSVLTFEPPIGERIAKW